MEIIAPTEIQLIKFLGAGGYGEVRRLRLVWSSICGEEVWVHCTYRFALGYSWPKSYEGSSQVSWDHPP